MWLYKLAKFISVLLVLWLSHVVDAYTYFFINKYFVGRGNFFFGDDMQLKFGFSKLELKKLWRKPVQDNAKPLSATYIGNKLLSIIEKIAKNS